jgi:chromosomal replication initiation ATPase DnaA
VSDVLTAPDLETFFLDPANRAAAVAARAVADASGVPYGPLVVVGPHGSGKTELLQAIATRLRGQHATATIEVLVPDALAERYRGALVLGRGEAFRASLVGVDLLLLDDLERLVRHRDCQGLVADLIDARRAAGREIVVAADTSPAELNGLDARLVRRLTEGTTVSLSLPGAEARLGILRRRAAGNATPLPEPVIRAIAEVEFASMRDYTGAMARLGAFQEASAVPLTPRDALLLIGAPAAPAAPEPEDESSPAPEVESPTVVAPTRPVPADSDDEFGAFLTEITASVSEQVDRWRRRIGEAVLRWGGEGLRTRRLELLLHEEMSADPEPILVGFEADAREIQALAAEAAVLAPDLAGAELFRDPDQVGAARAMVEQARTGSGPLSAPLAHYRLEDLAEGPGNRLALQAARELLHEPGRRYSPLIVVGGSGVGKSHYLHGLGNALAARGITPVACLGGRAFVAEVQALADDEALAAWRIRYRWVGAFLMDDLHLLAGERRAQEELFLLVGELLEGQRQMILASSRPLEELAGLDQRLHERLQGGIVIELPPPDREIRLAVVKRLLAGTVAAQDAALADYLAGRGADSVRAVQGTVQRVLGEAAAQRVAPSPALAREVLEVMELGSGRGQRRSGGVATSGILSPGAALVRGREKMVGEWPSIADRLIPELR